MRNAKLLLFPLATVVLAVIVALILTWMTATPDERDEMSQWISEHTGQEEPEGTRQIEWDALPDAVVAWVEVPGTAIDEPIVQADSGYPDYYLYADVFGEGGYGTPYIDCDCSLEGPLTIVYGHHMDDGSVFADFARFSDRDYAMGHREIVVYLREGNRKVERPLVVNDDPGFALHNNVVENQIDVGDGHGRQTGRKPRLPEYTPEILRHAELRVAEGRKRLKISIKRRKERLVFACEQGVKLLLERRSLQIFE